MISFSDGVAVVSEQSIEELKEVFTIRLDTRLKQDIYDLLTAVSTAINQFNEGIKKANMEHGLNHGIMDHDELYMSSEDNQVIPKSSVFKYF
jgi:hypothetical protein